MILHQAMLGGRWTRSVIAVNDMGLDDGRWPLGWEHYDC